MTEQAFDQKFKQFSKDIKDYLREEMRENTKEIIAHFKSSQALQPEPEDFK